MKNSKGKQGVPVWLTLPALVFFVFFAVIPLFGVVGLSFMTWDGLGTPEWAGGQNWSTSIQDPVMHNALYLSVFLVVASWVFQTPISMLLGVFVAGNQRYRSILAALFFLPLLLSAAAVGIAYKAMLDPNFGISRAFNASWLKLDWLGDPKLAMLLVVFVISWQFIPFHTMIYQAGCKQIPESLYEAAKLDGAGRMRTFFSITLPQLKYTIITSSTLILVGALTYFDLVYVLTQGGPGNATRILPLHMYLTGFRSFQMGPAAVSGVILAILGLLIAFLLNKMSGFDRMESQQDGV